MTNFVKRDLFLFKPFHAGKLQMELAEKWISGNESLLIEGRNEYYRKMHIYLECKVRQNITCTEALDQEKRIGIQELSQKLNETITSMDEFFDNKFLMIKRARVQLMSHRKKLMSGEALINQSVEMIWSVCCLVFFFMGILGALASKGLLDWLGSKSSVLSSFLMVALASLIGFTSFVLKSPICLLFSIAVFGFQSGLGFSSMYVFLR
jgi:hypothetical protein